MKSIWVMCGLDLLKLLYTHQHIQIMDLPFIEGISGIQETEAMTGSRSSFIHSPRNLENLRLSTYLGLQSQPNDNNNESPSFHQLREYVERTLSSWGMKPGYMPESSENKYTINCFMELISQKFNEQESREQLKKSLASAQFERNKYQSLLEQERSAIAQKNKTIGRLENALTDYRTKMKQLETVSKKERDEDKKMIAMLKSKNEQIQHEIKKRQQETNRVKQQMKKSLGEKSNLKNVTFEVYEAPLKEGAESINQKVQSLKQIFQNERKNLLKENLILRETLYQIRDSIVKFAYWIDINLFREESPDYKNKFVVNHCLLLKKSCLTDEFNVILENSKSGIKQLIDMFQEGRKREKPIKQNQAPRYSYANTQAKVYQQNLSPNKVSKQAKMGDKKPRQTIPVMRKKSLAEQKPAKLETPLLKKHPQTMQPEFELEDQQSELSMISYVSTGEIVAENRKFDKWDILFNHQ